MVNYCLEFSIPGLPKTMNELYSSHWRTRQSHKVKWHRDIYYCTFGKTPPKPLKKAKLELTRYSSFQPDDDNLRSSFKHIIDALVECKILENDRVENIGTPDIKWSKIGPKKGFINIKIMGVE